MTNKLNVLQIIDSLEVGGAEMMAVNMANGLVDRGVESHLCATRKEGGLKVKLSSKVQYFFLTKNNLFDLRALNKLIEYVKLHRISIIHVHSTSVFFSAFLKFFCPKLKLIWHNHTGANTNLTQGLKYYALIFVLKFYCTIINVSNDLNVWSTTKIKFKDSKYLSNFPSKNIEKTTFLKSKKSKKIIIVAALRKEKKHLNLLKAYNQIKENYPDWSLHIIGTIPKTTNTDTIKEYIEKNDLKDSVFLYGAVLDVFHVLSQADIAVLSSKSEGLPVSLLEYGLAGLPVVVTNVGECKNVVNSFGLIVEKNNSEALFLALEQYIKDKELRQKMGENFKKHIENNYSEKIYFDKLIKIYNQC